VPFLWELRAHLLFDNSVMVMMWHLTSRGLCSQGRSTCDVFRERMRLFIFWIVTLVLIPFTQVAGLPAFFVITFLKIESVA